MTKPFTSNSTSLGTMCVPIRRGGSRIFKKVGRRGRGGGKGWVREALSVAVMQYSYMKTEKHNC